MGQPVVDFDHRRDRRNRPPTDEAGVGAGPLRYGARAQARRADDRASEAARDQRRRARLRIGGVGHARAERGFIWTRISRGDVADFMLRQLIDDEYLGTAVGVYW